MEDHSNLETTPEKALIVSYIIKLLNRNASAQLDRLLKEDYEQVKRNPLILDAILRGQLMAFFSKTGSEQLLKSLIEYYRDYLMFSALLDAKNILVICEKEKINKSSVPFNESMTNVVLNLISRGKTHILKHHIKSVLASCILTGNLSPDFKKLMKGELDLDPSIEEVLRSSSEECQKDLKNRILENRETPIKK